MGNWHSKTTRETSTNDAVPQGVPMISVPAKNTAEPTTNSPLLDLTPELRALVYEYVLQDFDINNAPVEDRDLAAPILNVSRSISEEVLAIYEDRIRKSREEASKELKIAVDKMSATLLAGRFPMVDASREKIAVCDVELAMIQAVKEEYKMI